jgi:excisionase family DNA binding protein
MKVENNDAETSLRLLLTVDEAADRLSLGRTKVQVLLMRGDLSSVRIGTARRCQRVR